jgi:hypothetical protein
LDGIPGVDNFAQFSDFGHHVVATFSEGFGSFREVPITRAMVEATEEIRDYTKVGSISRLLPVADGPNYWQIIEAPPVVKPPGVTKGGMAK